MDRWTDWNYLWGRALTQSFVSIRCIWSVRFKRGAISD